MDRPQNLQHYLRLMSGKPLDKEYVRLWFNVVQNDGPNGVVGSIQQSDPKGNPQNVQLIHKKLIDGNHFYDVILTRDLEDIEVSKIGESWEDQYPFPGWEIEASADNIISMEQDTKDNQVYLRESDYNSLCEQLAKHQHSCWMKKKCDEGWCYGIKHNKNTKTHPMLLPWEQLPENYRNIDKELPRHFIQLLNRQGYQVIHKGNLFS